MADLRAFRGFRYDLGKVGALSDVVAPPYDVVSPALQQALYDRSPHNAIRLELTQDLPGDHETNNRYTRAAQTLNQWQLDQVVKQESLRAIYVVEQQFTVERKTYHRRGFMARVRLEPFGTGRIFPHEQTMSGPKEDRLKLYRSTAMNVSPIFGLYPDPQNDVLSPLEPLLFRTPPLTATDHLGVISKLWPIYDEAVLTAIIGAMTSRAVFIADGHHRYETGLRYLEERRAAGEVANEESPANFTLMMLVSMSDPGLIILPTHRLLSGIPDWSADQLRSALQSYFDLEVVGMGEAAGRETWERIELDGGQNVLGLHTACDGVWQLARLRSAEPMLRFAPEHSDDWRDLAVSILHVLIVDRILPESTGTKPQCRYVHLLQEVNEALAAKECSLAVLVPPATMDHVESIAGSRETMPAKSTYFYPKLLTGLVFNSLKVN